MWGDGVEGEDLLKRFGCHPEQIAQILSKTAVRLKCEPTQVLQVLRGAKKLPPDLKQILQQLEEARRMTRHGA
jgi:hypothetical protein